MRRVLFRCRAYVMHCPSIDLFFRATASVHPRFRTPHVAIVVTCGWAALLTLTGTYEQLYTYVVFTALLFNVAGGLAIFKLRWSKPDVAATLSERLAIPSCRLFLF